MKDEANTNKKAVPARLVKSVIRWKPSDSDKRFLRALNIDPK